MAIVVDVELMRGKRVSLEADLTASVHCLKKGARRALGVGPARLCSPSGKVDDTKLGTASLQA